MSRVNDSWRRRIEAALHGEALVTYVPTARACRSSVNVGHDDSGGAVRHPGRGVAGHACHRVDRPARCWRSAEAQAVHDRRGLVVFGWVEWVVEPDLRAGWGAGRVGRAGSPPTFSSVWWIGTVPTGTAEFRRIASLVVWDVPAGHIYLDGATASVSMPTARSGRRCATTPAHGSAKVGRFCNGSNSTAHALPACSAVRTDERSSSCSPSGEASRTWTRWWPAGTGQG